MDGSISCLSSWAWEPALSEESVERGVYVKTLGLISLSLLEPSWPSSVGLGEALRALTCEVAYR